MELVNQDRTGGLAAPVTARLYEGRVARIHRDGDPLRYPEFPESHRIQYRDQAGLEAIRKSLVGRPFTLLHPEDLVARLIADGKGDQVDIVGSVVGARIDGDYVIAQILITDPRGEQAIRDGVHELSLGYVHQLDSKLYQRLIQVDHLALVPRARCGSTCALQLDCAADAAPLCKCRAIGYHTEIVADQPTQDNVQPGITPALVPVQDPPRNIVMDELQKQLAAALADAAQQTARANQLTVELKTAKDALTTAQVDATNAQAALVTEKQLTADAKALAVQANTDAQIAVSGAVKSRVQLLTEANRVLGEKDDKGVTIDRSDLDDSAVRLAVIKQVDGLEFSAEQIKNTDFVKGVYTGSLARFDAAAKSRTDVRQVLVQNRTVALDAAKVAAPVPGAQNVNPEARERAAMLNRTRRN